MNLFYRKFITYKRGFTLIEMLISIAIGILIATVVTSVAISALKSVSIAKHYERLHSNAFYVSTTIGYWMRQSSHFDVLNSKTLLITLPDFSQKTLALSGNSITLDGVSITSSELKVVYFEVVQADRSVRIGFSLKFVKGPETVSATTTVAQRNLF